MMTSLTRWLLFVLLLILLCPGCVPEFGDDKDKAPDTTKVEEGNEQPPTALNSTLKVKDERPADEQDPLKIQINGFDCADRPDDCVRPEDEPIHPDEP